MMCILILYSELKYCSLPVQYSVLRWEQKIQSPHHAVKTTKIHFTKSSRHLSILFIFCDTEVDH